MPRSLEVRLSARSRTPLLECCAKPRRRSMSDGANCESGIYPHRSLDHGVGHRCRQHPAPLSGLSAASTGLVSKVQKPSNHGQPSPPGPTARQPPWQIDIATVLVMGVALACSSTLLAGSRVQCKKGSRVYFLPRDFSLVSVSTQEVSFSVCRHLTTHSCDAPLAPSIASPLPQRIVLSDTSTVRIRCGSASAA